MPGRQGERGLAGKIGSLLVGVYEREKLRFAGNVGTAFTDRERDASVRSWPSWRSTSHRSIRPRRGR